MDTLSIDCKIFAMLGTDKTVLTGENINRNSQEFSRQTDFMNSIRSINREMNKSSLESQQPFKKGLLYLVTNHLKFEDTATIPNLLHSTKLQTKTTAKHETSTQGSQIKQISKFQLNSVLAYILKTVYWRLTSSI